MISSHTLMVTLAIGEGAYIFAHVPATHRLDALVEFGDLVERGRIDV